jgi:DNA invertase Pin-like site-specific DNA recombinase
MLVGYTRVSTIEQNVALQEDALKGAGCTKLFHDSASGAKAVRPGLTAALEFVREGDVLVFWRLDRLGRSLADLLVTVKHLEARGVGFKSLTEAIDTTTSGGRLVFQLFGAMAEFERNLIKERTLAGLSSARARGRFGGRPKVLDEQKVALARQLYAEKKHTVKDICVLIGVTKPCLYDYLQDRHKGRAEAARRASSATGAPIRSSESRPEGAEPHG